MVTSALVVLLLLAAPGAEREAPAAFHGAASADPEPVPAAASRPVVMPPGGEATRVEYDPARDVARAVRRLHARDLLRIEGDFGRFEGTAAHVSLEGLSELQRAGDRDPAAPAPGLLRWDQIDRLERRGNHGVIVGSIVGITTGLAAGVGYAKWSLSESSTPTPWLEGLGAGAAVGACGALVGWCVGALIPRWQVVYRGH